MEAGWWRNSFGGGDGSRTGGDDVSGGGVVVEHNNNNINNAWGDIWNVSSLTPPASAAAVGGTTRYDWRHPTGITTARVPEESVIHALLLGHDVTNSNYHARSVLGSSSSNSVVHHRMRPDPHMICLKLGKRHYCEDAVVPDRHVTPEAESSFVTTKRNKLQPYHPYGQVNVNDIITTAAATATSAVWPGVRLVPSLAAAAAAGGVPRCQVEGCHVALGNSKEYYRRHKVCEIHSKSPKVVVLGLQQRFCQQCSRFHGVTEFDEAKRSCRRRLEGHNQRRRKGSLSNSLIPRSFPHHHEYNCMMERPLQPSPPQSKAGCALSLLSSPKTEPWISSDDLSTRCSAALYELIAANRATSVVAHRLNQDEIHQSGVKNAMETLPETQMWDGFDHTAMTLDLKQAPASNSGLFSVKEKSKNPEEWTDYCWSAFGGSNVV